MVRIIVEVGPVAEHHHFTEGLQESVLRYRSVITAVEYFRHLLIHGYSILLIGIATNLTFMPHANLHQKGSPPIIECVTSCS